MVCSNLHIQPASSIPLHLIAAAFADAQPPVAAEWPESCQAILEVYVREHYEKISETSPEYEIIKPSEVKRTGGKVFTLHGGQEYTLPANPSAYIAIPLGSSGNLTVEVTVMNQQSTHIPWTRGSLVYLREKSVLKCSGDGIVVCIMLGMMHERR